ncbi:MAG: hypothetical protein AVDCRST_MAG89-4931, partial [uncultured Gemmatimonadetes bacterium]
CLGHVQAGARQRSPQPWSSDGAGRRRAAVRRFPLPRPLPRKQRGRGGNFDRVRLGGAHASAGPSPGPSPGKLRRERGELRSGFDSVPVHALGAPSPRPPAARGRGRP